MNRPWNRPRNISELKRALHIARRTADRIAIDAGPRHLREAIDALPDRTLLAVLPEGYRRGIERSLDDLEYKPKF